ncbi:hypothetical protein PN416_17890 [Halorubrum ezzemoulense]|uniref:hypothetical protein n=1 Tax=Halorubrum ezzemoulense TaxID=337243 RepID=UPI00232CA64E|nr:hypothetical protein [Halorubrum ezzemoulense]MDB9281729.1 hypothetical protein [Halorubrum ezzemoulense]MDB9285247.1 hypothetical protein [Halorubrum ezzemoulense]
MTDPTDTDDVKIYSQWPRVGCLRLRPPERDDGTPPAQSHPLASVIRSAFSNTKLRRLELLSWPAAPHQEWVLHPIDSTVQAQPDEDDDLDDPNQTQVGQFGTSTSVTHDEASAATGALESACKEQLVKPYGYGYDRCAVDLSPLEGTIRPTCRLAVRESPDLLPLAQRNPHGVVELISDLNDQDVPYLLQTIISRGGKQSDFELSQRLAVYRPNYGLATEHDFAKHLDTGERVDLSTYYDDQTNRIRSNFDLDATRYFDIDTSGDRYEAVSRHKHDVEIIRAARRVLAGRKDCHDLYAGYHDTDKELENLYQYANYYTKIPVDKRTVRAFVALVSDSIEYSPWENVGYIDPPKLITNPVVVPTTAGETADPEGASPENVTQYDDEQSVRLMTQGSAEHQLNEDWVVDYFADAGWTVKQLDTEATESVPDIWIQKDEIEYFVEVEHKGTDQPANVLTNAARAAHYDMDVIFVVKKKPIAQSIAKMLREPVTDTDVHNGAQLYTMSDELTLTDGSKPVLPPDVESSQWYLRYQEPPEAEDEDDTDIKARSPSQIEPELRLETPDGEVLAAGSVDESVATWEFEELLCESDPSAADRTNVHGPFVPTQLAYLARSSLRYRNGDQLERLDPNEYPANWNQSDAAGKRERYKNAYETFVDRYTVAVDYTEIEKPDFIKPMNERIYKPQTSRKAPGMRESGRALWQFAERKSRDNNALDLIKNRTWRWPHDVTSPDMSFVGHSTVLSELGLEE